MNASKKALIVQSFYPLYAVARARNVYGRLLLVVCATVFGLCVGANLYYLLRLKLQWRPETGDGPGFVLALLNLAGALALGMAAVWWSRRMVVRHNTLQREAQRYRITTDMVSDYTYYHRINPDGSVEREWISGAFEQVTGLNPRLLLEDQGLNIYHPDDRARAADDKRRVALGEQVEGEYRLNRDDGTLRWVRIVRVPEWNETQTRVIGYYGVGLDITSRRLAEEERLQFALRQQQISLMGEFVRAISHDFRNRLSTIESNRHLIARIVDEPTKDKISPRLDNIRASMQGIMEQLDNLSVIAGLTSHSVVITNLHTLLRQVTQRHLAKAFEKGLQLRFEGEPNLHAYVDEAQFERVIHHLLRNALAHTSAGGEIVVRACETEAGVVIEVSDSGHGIPEDKLTRIFEPFFRGDEARTITEAGIGIGLTIVRLIVDAHQGTMHVNSAVGQGTTFRITLPTRGAMIA